MTNEWKEWKAQSPSADFASRTVAAALAEKAHQRRPRGLAARRALVAGAMAAVLVVGAAWGFTAWRAARGAAIRHDAPRVVRVDSDPTGPAIPSPPAPPLPPPAPPPGMVPQARPSASVAPPVRPAHRKVDSPPVPDAGRAIVVPPCSCSPQEDMCTCN